MTTTQPTRPSLPAEPATTARATPPHAAREAREPRPSGAAPRVEPEEVWADGAPRPDWFLLDVRTPGEFAGEHIPGAVNVPLSDLGRLGADLRKVAGDKHVAIVCRTSRRAETAYGRLTGCGVRDLSVLDGGVVGWHARGLPTRLGERTMSLERQTRIVAGLIVVAGAALALFVSPWFAVLPAFIGAGLVHAGATDRCAMGMFLALLPYNRRAATTCDVRAEPPAA